MNTSSHLLWLRSGVRGLPGGTGVDDLERVGVLGVRGESSPDVEVVLVNLRVLDSVESAALYFLTGGPPKWRALVSTATVDRRGIDMAECATTYTEYLQKYIRMYSRRRGRRRVLSRVDMNHASRDRTIICII